MYSFVYDEGQVIRQTSARLLAAFRRLLRALLIMLLWLFTRLRLSGGQHVPLRGGFIIAGNHEAIFELALMVAVSRRALHIVGAGDIPLDPTYRWMARLYGFVPYRRGLMDRKAVNELLGYLSHGDGVGMFPEGGIWSAARKEAHRGVAWLAARAQVPVVPVGFSGSAAALPALARIRRPTVCAACGPPLFPPPARAGRDELNAFARELMARVDRLAGRTEVEEADAAEPSLRVEGQDGDLSVPGTSRVAWFLANPTLICVFTRNLRRKLPELDRIDGSRPELDAQRLAWDLRCVRAYVFLRNRAFFSYRFGADRGSEIMEGLRLLAEGLEKLPAGSVVRIYASLSPNSRSSRS